LHYDILLTKYYLKKYANLICVQNTSGFYYNANYFKVKIFLELCYALKIRKSICKVFKKQLE